MRHKTDLLEKQLDNLFSYWNNANPFLVERVMKKYGYKKPKPRRKKDDGSKLQKQERA